MSALAVSTLGLTAALLAPHLVPVERISPISGIILWGSVLLMRAAIALSLVVGFVFLAPATELFSLLTRWCMHTVLPFLSTHLGFSGHSVGDVAVVVPALILTASLLSLIFAVWRGARRVRRWLNRSSLGPGPRESVVVGGSEVLVAVAGMRAPRVVVSAGALVNLDDEELEAGLEHEWGHVVRRHRFISMVGCACLAISRFLPGGRRALAQMQLHLERDADDYAVARTGDPLALASAICKAADGSVRSTSPAFAGLGSDAATVRLRRLIGDASEAKPTLRLLPKALAAVLVAGTLAVTSSAAAIASTDPHARYETQTSHIADC